MLQDTRIYLEFNSPIAFMNPVFAIMVPSFKSA